VLYGNGLWWANKTECRIIESIKLAALKRILGVSSKTIDIPIRLDLGIMSLKLKENSHAKMGRKIAKGCLILDLLKKFTMK